MFCPLTYLFGHSIYFARLHHVNPLCKHKCAFLQMKEAPNQKVQEKKPLLKFKNTKKYMCLERIWRKKCFWACRQRPLLFTLINENMFLTCSSSIWSIFRFLQFCAATLGRQFIAQINGHRTCHNVISFE